jgi:hypothetical protein
MNEIEITTCTCEAEFDCECECSLAFFCDTCEEHTKCQGLGEWINEFAYYHHADGSTTSAACYIAATPSVTAEALGGTVSDCEGSTADQLLSHLDSYCEHLREDAEGLADEANS